MPSKTAAFLSYGFRPFFLFAGIHAVIAMAAWMAWFGWNGENALDTDFPPMQWHAHEMLFGYATAALAGFLLTAAPNWTGAQPVNGGPLALLAGVWAAGRAAVWFSAFLPPVLVAAADLAFPALLFAFMVRALTGGSPRHMVFLAVLALLFAANAMVHLERLGLSDDTAAAGHRLAFDVFVLLIAVIGGRVVPAFTRGALTGESDPLPPRPWIDGLAVFSVLAVLIADQLAPDQPAAGGLALGAAAINGLRLIRWQGWRVLDQPIVWILHLGYAWLVVGLAFKGLAQLSDAVDGATALHVLSVGAIGSMTIGVMTRAGLGHTGRALKVTPAITFAYLLLSAAAVVRVGGPMWLEEFRQAAMVTAGVGWCVAFAVFTWVYWPILTGPRVDEN